MWRNILKSVTASNACRSVLSKPTSKKCLHSQPKLSASSDEEFTIGVFGWSLLIIPISTFALGVWQVGRKRWKEELMADLKERFNMKPVSLLENINELTKMEYHPVTVRGHYLPEKSVLMGPRSLLSGGDAASSGGLMSGGQQSNTGYHLITPFKVADQDDIIMVNRGWIPANKRRSMINSMAERNQEEHLEKHEEDVDIVGVVRLNEDRPALSPHNRSQDTLLYRDLSLLSRLTGATVPVFLDVRGPTNDPEAPIPDQTRITLRNEHMSYIITWFALSAFTGLMWHRHFIRRLPPI